MVVFGQLHVSGNRILDQNNDQVYLCGPINPVLSFSNGGWDSRCQIQFGYSVRPENSSTYSAIA